MCMTEGFQIVDDWIKDSGSSLDYVLTNFYNHRVEVSVKSILIVV